MHNRPTRAAAASSGRQVNSPPSHTGRLGTRAIVAPVAWEMMDVSDPRTPTCVWRFRLPIGGPRDAVFADPRQLLGRKVKSREGTEYEVLCCSLLWRVIINVVCCEVSVVGVVV